MSKLLLGTIAGVMFGALSVAIMIKKDRKTMSGKDRVSLYQKIISTSAPAAVVLIRLIVGGVFFSAANVEPKGKVGKTLLLCPLAFFAQGTTTAAALSGSFGLWPLFLFFLKVGTVLFGSGYVLIVFLRADLVGRWHWLTEAQLLDAIAVGQMIPGPVFTTATFIGYLLAGPQGAVVATVGIFLPAFIFVAASGPLVPRIRRSKIAGAVLDGVNAASLSLMAVVTYQLGRAALVDLLTVVLFMGSLILLMRSRLNSAWLGLLIHTAHW